MRTALSRMAAKGDVRSTEAGYALSDRLVERQRRQDAGRTAVSKEWDTRWRSVTPLPPSRSLSERRDFRRTMQSLRFGELRPDHWLRPANLPAVEFGPEVLVVTGTLEVADQRELVNRLWPIGDIETLAQHHLAEIDRTRDMRPGQSPSDWLAEAFGLSADIVRFLMTEPALPPALVPSPWAPAALRSAYDQYEELFQARLTRFLKSAG